jgi:hypothetical protein
VVVRNEDFIGAEWNPAHIRANAKADAEPTDIYTTEEAD